MATNLTCITCSKNIESEYVNLGDDRAYHPDCFSCSVCKKSLGGEQYFEMENELFCEADYHKKFSPTCGGCHEIIIDEYVEVLGLNYHKKCFVCQACKKPFGELQYYKYNGEPYCNDCYQMKATQCHSCGKPILDKTYSALNKTYHLDCFVCPVCSKPFEGGSFVPHEDKPYHQACFKNKFGKKCGVCHNDISGEYYDIDGVHIHKDCYEKYKTLGADEKKKLADGNKIDTTTTTTTTATTTTTTTITEVIKKPEEVKTETKPTETKPVEIKPTATEEKKEDKAPVKIEAKVEVKINAITEPILKTTEVPAQKIQEGVKTSDKESGPTGTVYSYELLTKPPFPKGVDPTKREQYLSHAEFERLFKMKWEEWLVLAKWKQTEAKKKFKLF